MKICNKAYKITQCNNYYSLTTDGCEIRIFFVTDDIIRIKTCFDGEHVEESYSLVTCAWEDRLDDVMSAERNRVEVADSRLKQFQEGSLREFDVESTDGWVIFGRKLALVVEADPFRMSLYDQDGDMLHRDIVDLSYREDANGRVSHTSEIVDGDGFYGFGEQTGQLNKFQERVVLSPGDAMGYDPEKREALYKHIPFYIKLNKQSKKALGYFYHNTYNAQFDMGRSHSNYWKRHSTYSADGGEIDLFLVSGPRVDQVVAGYTLLTGKPAMLPKKALGYLGSSMYYSELDDDCHKALVKFITTAKNEGFPIDGFQLSSGYTSQETKNGLKRCVFTWNDKRFPDPEKYFQDMKELGAIVSPNVKPGILLDHPDIEDFLAKDVLVKASDDEMARRRMHQESSDVDLSDVSVGTWWGGKGVFWDFTKREAREEWKRLLKENVLSKGTSSVWNDNCEYDSLVDQDAYVDFDGRPATIARLRNVQSNLMCKVAAEAIREQEANVRPYIVCRAGHAGIQRYAQNWSGDNLTSWKSLKHNVATMLGMALSGVSNYGCDIGGFYGKAPEPELLVRWVQNGIFQPRFSIHSVNTDNTVTEPWMYPEYTGIIRDAIKFRYSLLAYYYSLMMEANQTGIPIMRPIMMEYPDDESMYDEDREFMIGHSLFVSNVLEQGETTHQLRLPRGAKFYHLDTREAYEGGENYSVPVSLSDIPMYIPSGGILPMIVNDMDNADSAIADIRYIVAGDRDGSFSLYEDDGISLDYTKGDYRITDINMICEEDVTYIDFSYRGDYKTSIKEVTLDIISSGICPSYVTIDGEIISQHIYKPDYLDATTGWYYDIEKHSTYIKYHNICNDYQVVVSYKSLDMLGM